MKFSFNWIRQLVEGLDASPSDLARLITLKTAECENVVIELDQSTSTDYVIEVDNKSLTHRPDLWGHHGMAREVAAIFEKRLLDPVKPRDLTGPAAIHIDIEDYSLCPRYSALVFENVTVQPSPRWLAERLEAVGLNTINNIVDVTNFVMAELAQPMHAFDAAKLNGNTIFVRSAKPREEFVSLSEEVFQLDPSNLVIADGHGTLALAGVKGGISSGISDSTTRIVLESANFNAISVRKTSARLHLRTDASMRFEKAQDPVNTVRGLQRALELLERVSPGIRLVGGLADARRLPAAPPPLVLSIEWLIRKLGRSISAAEVRAILEALEFKVEQIHPQTLSVFVPTWRATKDISIREDLVEEVGRMIGYDSITPVAPLTPARVPPASPTRVFHNRIREMAAAQGFTEVYNYSFLSDDQARAFGFDPAECVQVANPIAAGQNLLRPSLLPLIAKNIADNARYLDQLGDQFRFFEIGREIHPDREVPHLAAAIFSKSGSKDDGVAGLLELKRLAECLAPGVTVRPRRNTHSYEHPQRAADVFAGELQAGRLFEFHPGVVEAGRAAILDLDLEVLETLQPAARRYQPLRRFPASAFDLSVVVPPRVLIGDVQMQLEIFAGADLLEIYFLRDFALPNGDRSLSYRLTVGSAERTLSSDEISASRARIIKAMQEAGFNLTV
jgi:phenylalanyl-tRNA synthetase beta chain